GRRPAGRRGGRGRAAEPRMSDVEELRALVREVIRDVLPQGLAVTETVNLSTDEDLAAFVKRLLDLDPGQREELRSGRKRFRLAELPNGAFLEVEAEGTGQRMIAFDVLGSGVGERVLITQGSVAAAWFAGKPPPVDALIIGSIDPDPQGE